MDVADQTTVKMKYALLLFLKCDDGRHDYPVVHSVHPTLDSALVMAEDRLRFRPMSHRQMIVAMDDES